MKNRIFILFFLVVIPFVHSQNLSGVWISNDSPLQNSTTSQNNDDCKTIIDFDANVTGCVNTNTTFKLTAHCKKTKLKIQGVKGKLKIEKRSKNKMVLKGSNSKSFVFEKLDLKHKLKMSENDLRDFLINQQCDLILGNKGQFTKERYFLDKKAQNSQERYQYINFSKHTNGYWNIKTIKGNAFLIFEAGQNKAEGVFQILSVNINGFKLLPLLENNPMKSLLSIRTCL